MKVLLVAINAKYIHSNLAVYSLKAYGQQPGVSIELGEYTINNYKEEILKELYEAHADVIAFSCYIWNIDYVHGLMASLKKVCSNTEIWLGGPEVSYDASLVLQEYPEVELVMCGEGEGTFRELLTMKKQGKADYEKIAGIAYRNACGNPVLTRARGQMKMDELPFVYEDLGAFTNKILYYETSRGCPFSCSYCLSSIDKSVRLRSFSLVQKELQFFIDHRVPQVKFVDRTFNCNRQHALAIWNYILEHDNGITNFHFEISADLIQEEELAIFHQMRPGLIQLEIGVQSTFSPTIEEIHRSMDLDRLKDIVLKVNNMGNIHQHLDLIAGLPYENLEQFKISFNEVYAMAPNQLQLGFLKVLKGSYMYENQEKYGIKRWESAPYEVLSTNWITYGDILTLKAVEDMVEVYYNSNQFLYSLRYLLHFFDTPYDFFEQLAKAYKGRDLIGVKHSRLARYEILREFAVDLDGICEEVLDNLLLFDLYLRENIKSRPDWAPDRTPYKKLYGNFYRNSTLCTQYFGPLVHYDSKAATKFSHIELFTVDMEEAGRTGCKVPLRQHILFDYNKRNPLTHEAVTTWIKELENNGEGR